jgi:hypothetical protein
MVPTVQALPPRLPQARANCRCSTPPPARAGMASSIPGRRETRDGRLTDDRQRRPRARQHPPRGHRTAGPVRHLRASAPGLQYPALGRNSAHYVDQTDSDVIETLIGKAVLTADVQQTAIVNKELVQYYCSDWDFMLARADALGLLPAVVGLQTGVVLKVDADPEARAGSRSGCRRCKRQPKACGRA